MDSTVSQIININVWKMAAALLALPSALHAQQPPPQTRSDTLPTVRVTVLRTPFSLKDAPFSITRVISQDAVVARPGFSMDEVIGPLAGVQVDDRLNFAVGERIAIRGIGARSQFGVRGVRVIVDDIPATLADGQTTLSNVDLGSLGSAEVLRGPASALYGNASGGVILLESAPAPAGTIVPNVRLISGSDGLRRGQIGVGGTSGQASYTLTGDRLDYGGFRNHSDARNAHANGVFTYDAGKTLVKVVVNTERHATQNPGSLSDSLLRIDRRQAFINNVVQQTGEDGDQTQGGASARVMLPIGELRLSGYLLTRGINNPIPPGIVILHRHAGGERTAYAFTAGNAHHSITTLVGTESDVQHDDRQNYVNNKGTRGAVTLDQHEAVTSFAPFTQISAGLDALHIVGGIRRDQVRFAAADHLITMDNPDDSGLRRMSAVSSWLGVSYTPISSATFYTNTSTGFQTPTTSELANQPDGAGGFNPELKPERLRSAELGVRGRLGSRTAYGVAMYRTRVTGEVIPFELEAFAGRQFYRNAGAALHKGVDGDISVVINPFVSVRTSYSYIDARFAVDTVHSGADIDLRVPGIIPKTLTFGTDIGHPESRFLSLQIRAQSRIPVNDLNAVHSAGYVTTSARGRFPMMSDAALIGGIGNMLDTRYNTSVVVNAAGQRYFEPAAGRTVYLGIDWNHP